MNFIVFSFFLLWLCFALFITAGYVFEKKIDEFGGVVTFFLLCLFAPLWIVGILGASLFYKNTEAALKYIKDFFTFNFPKK